MIKLISVLSFSACVCLMSCSSPQPEVKAVPVMQSAKNEGLKVDTSLLASKNDPVCDMPLAGGIADTLTVDGKLYGFCSVECKESYKTAHHINP